MTDDSAFPSATRRFRSHETCQLIGVEHYEATLTAPQQVILHGNELLAAKFTAAVAIERDL
jgi:hypothetical protein